MRGSGEAVSARYGEVGRFAASRRAGVGSFATVGGVRSAMGLGIMLVAWNANVDAQTMSPRGVRSRMERCHHAAIASADKPQAGSGGHRRGSRHGQRDAQQRMSATARALLDVDARECAHPISPIGERLHGGRCPRRGSALVCFGEAGASADKLCGHVAGGHEAIMANLDESVGENVLHPSTQKFLAGYRDSFSFFGAEGDVRVRDREQALIGDADAMGISTQVAKDVRCAAKRALGVDDPVLSVERIAEPSKVEPVRESKLSAFAETIQGREKLSTEERAHDLHRKEVPAFCTDPPLAVERESAAGHDGVHVRMKAKVTAPRV